MPVATDEQVKELFCEACGDQVATLTHGRGPCCHNLPNPWHRGSNGLYSQTSESEDAEDEDEEEEEEEDETPRCTNCGATEWNITAEQRVRSGPDDGGTIWYAWQDFEVTACCAQCGHFTEHYELEAA